MIPPTKDIFADPESQDSGGIQKENLQVFSSGTLKFAIFESEIAKIVEWRSPAPLPHAPPPVLGVVSVQGRMLTVLDPVVLLGHSTNGNSSFGLIIALRGDEQLALAAVSKVDAQLKADPQYRNSEVAEQPVLSVINHNGETISVLDVKKLFAVAIRGRERRRRHF